MRSLTLSLLAGALLLASGCSGDPVATSTATPEALIAEGAEAAGRFSWETACDRFAAARQVAPANSPAWRQATLGLAVAWHQRTPASAGTIATATEAYEAIIAAAPTTVEAGLALYGLGQIAAAADYYQDREDLPAARKLFTRVIAGWEGQEPASLAALALADAWAADTTAESIRTGCAFLEGWLAKHPQDPYAVVGWQWLGRVRHLGLGDAAGAVASLRRAEALGFVGNGRQHEHLWRMARLAERELHDLDLAAHCYTRLIVDFPASGKSWEARERLLALGRPAPALVRFAGIPTAPPTRTETP